MHWFWRVAISVGAGWLVGYGAYHVVWDMIWAVKGTFVVSQDDPIVNLVWLMTLLFVSMAAVATHALLTFLVSRSSPSFETRCRRCGYILRGITEPRCPECGERI